MSKLDITVYYWGPTMMPFYGRAIGIYLTLNQAMKKYPEFKYQMKGTDALPDGTGMATPAISLEGNYMAQTPAILVALGEEFGLLGKNKAERLRVLQGIEDMNDIFGEHAKFTEDEERKNKWFTYLEKKLEGKQWMGGTQEPSVADFHGVFAFEWIVKKHIDFSAFPNTSKWWTDIKAYPVVAELIASCVDGRSMIP